MKYEEFVSMCNEAISDLDKHFGQYNAKCDDAHQQVGFALIIYDLIHKRPVTFMTSAGVKEIVSLLLKLLTDFIENLTEVSAVVPNRDSGQQEKIN